MAIHYDPRLYTAGTAVFNPQPITQATAQVAAYKKAKNDALENYYKENIEKLNTNQIRPQDAEGFNKQLGDLKMYYLTNKEKLKKGDVNANMGYDRLWQQARNYALTSKGAAEGQKELMDVGLALKKEGGTVPDSYMTDVQTHDLPISDPKWKRFNAVPYIMEPAPFDVGKELKNYEDVKRTPTAPVVGATDQKTGKRLITQSEVFDPEAKGIIALRAASGYQNNRSFQREVNKSVENPGIKAQLDEVYKQQYGKEPEDKEDYAAAYILSQKQLLKKEEKLEDDKEWMDQKDQERKIALEKMKQGQRIALEGMKQGNRRSLAKYRADLKGLKDEEAANVLDNTFETMKADAKKTGARRQFDYGKPGKLYYEANVPNIIKKDFAYKDGSDWVYPDKILFNEEGGQVDVVFYKRKDGEIKKVEGKNAIDVDKSHSVDENQLKAMIGKKLFGVKTTSGAAYYGDEEDDEDEDDDDMGGGAPIVPSSGTKSSKKKIPGF